MYLAPFTYNRFFERVFKKEEIAKRFFEDMLDIVITEIKALPRKTKLTADAAYVEFDYRCKIDGQYVVLDMQQWYKQDVVKRFYMYDANNTSLQMESLAPISVKTSANKEYKTRDYNQIEPTTTIIWMVDDTLGYKENVISFGMAPDLLTNFMRDEAIWGANDWQTLLKLRAEILSIMNNNTKGLSFLSQNKLMFVFQKNIIQSPKMAKYVNWFKFAEATRNENNVEQDFEPYKDDPIFVMIMNELMINNLSSDDFQYIIDYAAFEKHNQAYQEMTKRNMFDDAKRMYEPQIKQAEQKAQQAEREKQQLEQKAQQAERERKKAEQEKQLRLIKKGLKRGDSNEEIADFLEIELEQLEYLLTLLPDEV